MMVVERKEVKEVEEFKMEIKKIIGFIQRFAFR